MNQTSSTITPPALQLPSGRLKASLSARELDFDFELLGFEGYQQKLVGDINKAASPRANWGVSEYSDLLGPYDASLVSQFKGISPRQTRPQIQSPSGVQMNQSQLLSVFGNGGLSSSPPISTISSSLGLDHSTAKAIMNSRVAAFAKRSQSFCDRGMTSSRPSTLSAMTTVAVAAPAIPNWGSPDGKLDWGIQAEELNKLRKSVSFAQRSNLEMAGVASAAAALGTNEQDLSWQTHLEQQNGYQFNGGGGDFYSPDMFAPWAEEKITA